MKIAGRWPMNPEEAGARAEIIAIGCSAGCFECLLDLLPRLPRSFPFPVLVLLHLPEETESMLPSAFTDRCLLPVKEAEDKEPIENGTVYFAPPGYHLLVEKEKVFSLSREEPVRFSRPSIDVLFESIAIAFGARALGVILSGANDDGAEGLSAILREGGIAVVENPETARFPVMPTAARRATETGLVFSMPELGEWLAGLPAGKRG